MKTEAFVSVQEYFRTSYEPDCDYVDGEVQERNVGERDHSKLQGELFFFFRQRQEQWKTFAFIEQRIQIGATRLRRRGESSPGQGEMWTAAAVS